MGLQWLSGTQISEFLDACPPELCDLIIELREFVQQAAPEAHEAIKFNSLCYFKPHQPYGVIGGNVCGIGVKNDTVFLSFIHGAFLPDPDKLLQGSAKAKRQIPIRTSSDIRRAAFKKLIRSAIRYTPAAGDEHL